MNIFYLSNDVTKCAEDLCDKHVVKMATETVQIISTAYFLLTNTQGPYKPTHKHHPCVIWATESLHNIQWLCNYAEALGKEYTKRYNKQHLAITKLQDWLSYTSLSYLPFSSVEWTNPPQCMPEKYRQLDTILAYKDYYKHEKMKFATWKYSTKPDWL